MDDIRLIRGTSDLRGTCYFEFLPGKYKKECWNEESVFLSVEVFGLVEPIIARRERRFNHYSFVGIRRATWERIIQDLEVLEIRVRNAVGIDDLREAVSSLFKSTEKEFANNFESNVGTLSQMICELVDWLQETLKSHQMVSVLGM